MVKFTVMRASVSTGWPDFKKWLKTPLLHRFTSRRGKNRRAAEYMQILDVPISPDQRFEHNCALDLHLFGQQGIVGFNRA